MSFASLFDQPTTTPAKSGGFSSLFNTKAAPDAVARQQKIGALNADTAQYTERAQQANSFGGLIKNTFLGAGKTILSGAQKLIQPAEDAFKSGVQQTAAGIHEGGTVGAFDTVAGAATAALSPVAPLLTPISKVVNLLGGKIANIPAVQHFATTPQGAQAIQYAKDESDLMNILGTVLGGAETVRTHLPQPDTSLHMPNGDVPAPEATLSAKESVPSPTTASKPSTAESISTGNAPIGKEGGSAPKADTSGPFEGDKALIETLSPKSRASFDAGTPVEQERALEHLRLKNDLETNDAYLGTKPSPSIPKEGGTIADSQRYKELTAEYRALPKSEIQTWPKLTEYKQLWKQLTTKNGAEGGTPTGEAPFEGKPSKVGKSIEQKAVEAKLTQGFDHVAGYDPVTIKDQAERATALVNDDHETARAVIRGEKPIPEGLKGTALITAAEEHLAQHPDAQLAYELANSPLVSETSAAGQELRLAAERTPDSITAKFNEVKAARKAALEKKGGAKKVVKQATTEMKKEISSNASKRPTWESFIKEVQCNY